MGLHVYHNDTVPSSVSFCCNASTCMLKKKRKKKMHQSFFFWSEKYQIKLHEKNGHDLDHYKINHQISYKRGMISVYLQSKLY